MMNKFYYLLYSAVKVQALKNLLSNPVYTYMYPGPYQDSTSCSYDISHAYDGKFFTHHPDEVCDAFVWLATDNTFYDYFLMNFEAPL